MNKQHAWHSLVAAAATLSLSVAIAQVAPDEPQRLEFNGISVVNSGPDLDEVEKVKRMAKTYPLRIEFSGKGGDFYVADRLSLKQRGQVLADVPGAGPWVLMGVPNGTYELEASFGAQTLRRAVTVGRGGTTVHWVLPASIE